MRVLIALAAVAIAACAAQARTIVVHRGAPVLVEGRWCTAQAVFINVQWDCRYPTRALCESYKPRDRSCLENPNWRLYRR